MKNLILVLVAILFAVTGILAQTPDEFKYQAVLRNAGGQIMASEAVTVDISILQGSATGISVFDETHSVTTTGQGLINLNIGSQGDMSVVDFSADTYFIEISVNSTVMGTSQLLSVPYALSAKTAETADYNDLTNRPTIPSDISDLTDNNTLLFDGNYNSLTNLPTLFSGSYTDLTNKPDFTGWDTDASNDFSGAYTDLTGTPTAINDFTMDANSQNITNLADPVNDQDAATKAYVDAIIDNLYIQGALKLVDIDGNEYEVVKIGNQIWMAEDLKVTHYPNGDVIPNVTDNTAWGNLADNNTDDAYCFYNNNSGTDYGALYTYAAAIGDDWARDNSDGQGVCPDGWHLPTDAEWIILTSGLGGNSVAGGKLKETGTTHWNSPNTGATNESGFSALPSGNRKSGDGTFIVLGSYGLWWSATESNTSAWFRRFDYNTDNVLRNDFAKSTGYSVRCLRD